MTEGEIEELIDEADVDDNGVIDYGEFYGMMDQKPKTTSDKKWERNVENNYFSSIGNKQRSA